MEKPSDSIQTRKPGHWLRMLLERDFVLFGLIFSALTFVACWPIIMHPAWHLGTVPAADKGTNLWNLWWVYYALFERGISPLRCDMIFIPWGCDLRYHTLSIANGLIAAPITGLFGPSFAYNFLFVAWTALTGCFAAMWARQFGAGRAVAILIGIIAAFGPYRWAHQIHLNLFSTPWLFLAFYLCERSLKVSKGRYGMGITCAWILAFFSDWYYGLFVGFYLAIRSCVLFFQSRSLSSVKWIFQCVVLPGLVNGFLLWMYFKDSQALEGYVDTVSMTFSAFWSLDLLHLILPLWLLPHFPDIQQNKEFFLNPGMVLMVLPLLFGILVGKNSRFQNPRAVLLPVTGVFWLFSLGPILMWNAGAVKIFYGIPVFLPAGIFELIPGLTVIRVYARFAYAGFMAYLLLGLLDMQCWVDRKGYRRGAMIACSVLALVVVVETGWRFPEMVDYQPQSLVFPESPKPVLELPFTPSIRGGLHLFHQTIHHHPIFVAEFSRLGYFRNQYLASYPALDILNRTATGEKPADSKSFNLEYFCQEMERLGPKHVIFSSRQEDFPESEEIRNDLQKLLNACLKSSVTNQPAN